MPIDNPQPGGGGGGAVNSVTPGTQLSNSGTASDPILNHDPHTGDVTGATALTIEPNVVDNTKLADMPAFTFKGNDTAGVADPKDLTIEEMQDALEITVTYTGTYTGDGATGPGQAITGLGFQPKMVRVYESVSGDNNAVFVIETSDTIILDDPAGQGIVISNGKTQAGSITSLDADGFTVDGRGGPSGGDHPNKLGTVYRFWAH
jgi:hypothetical protein